MPPLPHHAEIALTDGGLLPNVDVGHRRAPRTLATPPDHAFDGVRVALERRFHGSVVPVAHPAADAARRGLLRARSAEEDTLHPAGDHDDDPPGGPHPARVRWLDLTTNVERRRSVALYDPKTALVIVDLQNDFADRNGSLYVDGGEDVIPVANEERSRARSAGAEVVFTQDWHPPHTPHFEQDGGVWPVHCVQGTWGAAFHPDVVIDGVVLRKGIDGRDGYSGF